MVATNPVLKETWIRNKLSALTLEQKVGQMITAGFPGTILTPEVVAMITHCHLGGVMLSGANIKNPGQVADLNDAIQRVAIADASLPLFITVDQEGGTVNRLRYPATVMPSAMALGATRSIADVEECTRAAATEMRAVGINVNFAPVLDVNSEPTNPVIGVRSFGDSPSLVSEMGATVIKALHERGVMATAKHFPGHGDAKIDSHLGLPVILRSQELLRSVDLVPFEEAIASGVDMIMSAHAVYPTLTNTLLPATMSSELLIDLLRHEMGFSGLTITDALVMRAIADRYSLAEAAVLSVQSGADIVLTLGTLEEQNYVFDELVRAARRGDIAESAIDASVARILAAKWSITVDSVMDDSRGTHFADWPSEVHRRIARDAARRSVTLLKNDDHLLPFGSHNNERLGLIEFARSCFSPVEGDVYDDCSLYNLLSQRYANVRYIESDIVPTGGNDALRNFVEESDVIVVATRNAHTIKDQAATVRRIQEYGKPMVVLALRSPYDIMEVPSVSSYVASYGDSSVSLEATVASLFGDYKPSGKLPVSIPNLFSFDHGLDDF